VDKYQADDIHINCRLKLRHVLSFPSNYCLQSEVCIKYSSLNKSRRWYIHLKYFNSQTVTCWRYNLFRLAIRCCCYFLLGLHLLLCQCVKLTGICTQNSSYDDWFSYLILLVTFWYSAMVFVLPNAVMDLMTPCLILVIIVQWTLMFVYIPVLSITAFFVFLRLLQFAVWIFRFF
jgi:hypothetical protein